MLAKVIFSFPNAKWFVLVVERCDASLSLETLQSLTAQLHPQNMVKTPWVFFRAHHGCCSKFCRPCCIDAGITAGLARISAALGAAVTGHSVVRLILPFLLCFRSCGYLLLKYHKLVLIEKDPWGVIWSNILLKVEPILKIYQVAQDLVLFSVENSKDGDFPGSLVNPFQCLITHFALFSLKSNQNLSCCDVTVTSCSFIGHVCEESGSLCVPPVRD